jgi:hypothetical protein
VRAKESLLTELETVRHRSEELYDALDNLCEQVKGTRGDLESGLADFKRKKRNAKLHTCFTAASIISAAVVTLPLLPVTLPIAVIRARFDEGNPKFVSALLRNAMKGLDMTSAKKEEKLAAACNDYGDDDDDGRTVNRVANAFPVAAPLAWGVTKLLFKGSFTRSLCRWIDDDQSSTYHRAIDGYNRLFDLLSNQRLKWSSIRENLETRIQDIRRLAFEDVDHLVEALQSDWLTTLSELQLEVEQERANLELYIDRLATMGYAFALDGMIVGPTHTVPVMFGIHANLSPLTIFSKGLTVALPWEAMSQVCAPDVVVSISPVAVARSIRLSSRKRLAVTRQPDPRKHGAAPQCATPPHCTATISVKATGVDRKTSSGMQWCCRFWKSPAFDVHGSKGAHRPPCLTGDIPTLNLNPNPLSCD